MDKVKILFNLRLLTHMPGWFSSKAAKKCEDYNLRLTGRSLRSARSILVLIKQVDFTNVVETQEVEMEEDNEYLKEVEGMVSISTLLRLNLWLLTNLKEFNILDLVTTIEDW